MTDWKWGALAAALVCVVSPARAADEPVAPTEDGSEEPAASDGPTEASGERGLAISVGTGPQPLDTITLGITGLGARVLLPAGKGRIVLSGGHTSARGSSFPDTGFADRDFFRLGGTTVLAGYRGGSPPDEAAVVPYGIGGPMLMRGVTGEGSPGNDVFRNSLWAVGALVGVGVDGFVNRHVSAGVELGGLGGIALGGNRWRGESDDQFSGFALSTYASAQLTVWK